MYRKEKVLLICCSLILISCGDNVEQKPGDAFFSTIASYCGETFAGEGVYPDDPEHTLIGTGLRAAISTCNEQMIEIDLYRDGGNTWHATWILEKREAGLHLYHDHAAEGAEGDVLTGYGGYADDRGSVTQQFFPADDYTAEILPEAATNVWMMEVNNETGQFTYYLERHQEPRFRAEMVMQ
jgi:hypothetical protein